MRELREGDHGEGFSTGITVQGNNRRPPRPDSLLGSVDCEITVFLIVIIGGEELTEDTRSETQFTKGSEDGNREYGWGPDEVKCLLLELRVSPSH